MSRRSLQRVPDRPWTAAELRRGAEIVDEKALFRPYGARTALTLFSKNQALIAEMWRPFGGILFPAGVSIKYVLHSQPLVKFLEAVIPLLKDSLKKGEAQMIVDWERKTNPSDSMFEPAELLQEQENYQKEKQQQRPTITALRSNLLKKSQEIQDAQIPEVKEEDLPESRYEIPDGTFTTGEAFTLYSCPEGLSAHHAADKITAGRFIARCETLGLDAELARLPYGKLFVIVVKPAGWTVPLGEQTA